MRTFALFFLCTWLTAPLAQADVPPPNGYEERCTLQKSCPLGQECLLCPADYRDEVQDTSVCKRSLGSLGFQKKCQSWGASVWDEVWCRPVSGERDASLAIVPLDAGTPVDDPRFDKRAPVVVCQPGQDGAGGGCDGCALAQRGKHTASVGLGVLGLAGFLGLRIARRRSADAGGSGP